MGRTESHGISCLVVSGLVGINPSVSLCVFQHKPSRLTQVLGSFVWTLSVLDQNLGLFDDHEHKL